MTKYLDLVYNCLVFVVLFFLYEKFDQPFETLVISLLFIIYYSVGMGIISFTKSNLDMTFWLEKNLIKVLKYMKDPEGDRLDNLMEESQRAVDGHSKIFMRFMIFYFAAWIVVSVKIVFILLG